MATERLDILVRESGSRVVRRNIHEIGRSARRTISPIEQLNRAIGALGGALIATEVIRTADNYQRLQNRLRTVTDSTRELTTVTGELFKIARDTRQNFGGTVEIFTRTRLAVRDLGITQQETLNFTKSLNQAIILSGAGAREAQNALIQLSQGLASNTLRGDELRAVLEQLPVVSDTIAKGMGVTRGELRRLGAAGKISALEILKSFREAREELNQRFAKIVPTIAQSIEVLRTRFTELLGEIDQATGATPGLANAILFLADNLETLTSVLATAGILFAAFKLAPFARRLVAATKAELELAAAVRSGNAVLLNSAQAEALRAQAQRQTLSLQHAQTAARLRDTEVALAQVSANRALAAEQLRQSQNLLLNIRMMKGAAAGLGSHTTALRNVINAQRAHVALTKLETQTEAELAGIRRALTGQTAALSAAEGRSAAATAASASAASRASRQFPILSSVIGAVVGSFRALWAVIAANPITALIGGIIAAVTALIFFSDDITVTKDKVVTLADVFKATWTFIADAISAVSSTLREVFAPAIQDIEKEFEIWAHVFQVAMNIILTGTKIVVNSILGFWSGAIGAIIKGWKLFGPALVDLMRIAANGVVDVIEGMTNSVLDALDFLFRQIDKASKAVGGGELFGDVFGDVNLDDLKFKLSGASQELTGIIIQEFQDAFGTDFVAGAGRTLSIIGDRIIERARAFAKLRADLEEKRGSPPVDSKFLEELRNLEKENQLLRANATERAVLQEILNFERKLRRDLNETEKAQVRTLVEENLQLELQNQIYEDLKGPQIFFRQNQAALNALLEQGKINLVDFNFEMAKLRNEAGQGNFADGFITQLDRMLDRTRTFTSQAGEIFGSFFQNLTSGFSDSIGRAIVFSEDLGQSIKRVAQDALASLISALVELGLQFLINQVIATSLASAATAASTAQAAALGSAWALPAALASLATLGTNFAPAAAALTGTVALSKSLAAVGAAFAEGGLVRGAGGPRDDRNLAALSNGEFVVNAEATRRNLAALSAINAGSEIPAGGNEYFITMNFSGDAAKDPNGVGIAVERAIRRIVRDETVRQKRAGGVLRKGIT